MAAVLGFLCGLSGREHVGHLQNGQPPHPPVDPKVKPLATIREPPLAHTMRPLKAFNDKAIAHSDIPPIRGVWAVGYLQK
jgi:hypothetical protein